MILSDLTLFGFSVAIGAVQSISPDRWLPLSIHSWQKNWSPERMRSMSFFLSLIHVFLGVLLALIVVPFLAGQSREFLLSVFSFMVLLLALARLVRFRRIREVIGSGAHGRWGALALVSIMGPCELALPLWVKAGGGMGSLLFAMLGLALGTFAGVYFLTRYSQTAWNSPARLASMVQGAQSPRAWAPALALPLMMLLLIASA
jgi:hypothetical protein